MSDVIGLAVGGTVFILFVLMAVIGFLTSVVEHIKGVSIE